MVAAARQRPCLSQRERCPSAHTGAERVSSDRDQAVRTPSQSKIGCEEPIFDSSPKGRAKAACGGKRCEKLQFIRRERIGAPLAVALRRRRISLVLRRIKNPPLRKGLPYKRQFVAGARKNPSGRSPEGVCINRRLLHHHWEMPAWLRWRSRSGDLPPS